MFHSTSVPKCTMLKNIVATLSAIGKDLFSVGNQRVALFEALMEMLSGRLDAACSETWNAHA